GKDDPQSTTTAASAATTQLKTTETTAAEDDQSSKVSLGVNLDDLGNIINGQYFFDDGQHQFYSSFDANCAAHIYKTDKATQTTVSIFDGFGWSLVVRDGWLYFSGNAGATIDGTYNLFRMKLDGSSLEKIYDGFSYGMSLYNNKLYYISKSSYEAEDYAICRSNTDGSARETLVTDFNGYCIIYENMLYYTGQDGTFYRANPDGSQSVAILADKINYAIIGNGKLIYTDTSGNIKIAGIDGQDSQLVLAAGSLPVYSLNSSKDTIFYTVYDPTMDSSRYAYAYELYRIQFDGSGNQKIYQEYSYGTFINVVNGKVFTLDYAIDLATGNMPAIARSMDFSGGGVTDLPR
ncbi:MAG TPA: hypothetical protein DD640_06240, partial [Clostridiales bacterium]|nr:hypothetical protein [Clostridiales bacterium]